MSEDTRRIISGKMRDLKDPRIHGGDMLTIVRCDVAGDGSFCKVYVSSFEGYEKAKEAVKGFESATGFLKREISNVLKLKKCPELKFIADNSIEHSAKINKLLKEVLPEEEKEEKDGATINISTMKRRKRSKRKLSVLSSSCRFVLPGRSPCIRARG